MKTHFHTDPIVREQTIARYLARTLGAGAAEEFENHYLCCDDCYEELRAAELLIQGLHLPVVERIRSGDVTVIRFRSPAQLTSTSSELGTLVKMIDTRGDTKVLIDLQKVSRIDSTGLGMLMRCYTHAVRNAGVLKLLQPTAQVRHVLAMTRIDAVVPTYEDEAAALHSFR